MDHAFTDCTSTPSPTASSSQQTIAVSRCDRWQVQHRLQELGIPCTCPASGNLQVEVNSLIAAMQLRSVLLQFTANRSDLVIWLEQCWGLSA